MATSFDGGCSCGAVRYECSVDPVFTANVTAAIASGRAAPDSCQCSACREAR
jgi:hypothetical protein